MSDVPVTGLAHCPSCQRPLPHNEAERAACRPVTLAQIVAALEVTYTPHGVIAWLTGVNKLLDGRRAIYLIAEGRTAEVAAAVRRLGDADPADFTITDRSTDHV